MYDPNCAGTSADSSAPVSIDGIGGRALLHTRIFTGEFGSPATGLSGYAYRVNMSGAYGGRKTACVSALRLTFGPTVKLPYVSGGPYVDVFVVTTGGLGSIGLASAERDGNAIVFTFSHPVCAGADRGQGQSSFYFGLTSTQAPKAHSAELQIQGMGLVSAALRAAPVAEAPKPQLQSSARRVPKKKRRSSTARAPSQQ
jgi:hypothetical protein